MLRNYKQLNGAGIAIARQLLADGYTPAQVARSLYAVKMRITVNGGTA